jgi:hypothetical protein
LHSSASAAPKFANTDHPACRFGVESATALEAAATADRGEVFL